MFRWGGSSRVAAAATAGNGRTELFLVLPDRIELSKAKAKTLNIKRFSSVCSHRV